MYTVCVGGIFLQVECTIGMITYCILLHITVSVIACMHVYTYLGIQCCSVVHYGALSLECLYNVIYLNPASGSSLNNSLGIYFVFLFEYLHFVCMVLSGILGGFRYPRLLLRGTFVFTCVSGLDTCFVVSSTRMGDFNLAS